MGLQRTGRDWAHTHSHTHTQEDWVWPDEAFMLIITQVFGESVKPQAMFSDIIEYL